jgi:hypothetical protein
LNKSVWILDKKVDGLASLLKKEACFSITNLARLFSKPDLTDCTGISGKI